MTKEGSQSHSKGKDLATLVKELETPVESVEEITTSVFHRSKSMKDLCGTKARWEKLKNSTKIWNDPSTTEEFERGLLHPQLAQELYTLPSEVLLAQTAKEMVLRASELEKELEKTKRERDEALQRLEISDKELNEARDNLSEAQRQLMKAWVKARRMDNELLKSMKDLESTRAELPRRAIDDYKGSVGFKEGLKRMGQSRMSIAIESCWPASALCTLTRRSRRILSLSVPRTIRYMDRTDRGPRDLCHSPWLSVSPMGGRKPGKGITLSGFSWVTSSFAHSHFGRELHDSVIGCDRTPEGAI
ncbi:hypothetical protein B296_00035262 [Ensete ventricosum]|uniref:Uncharacterized protein n=1 Tax=Ensete ventricosum TaxID=4639 RepID=A0A426XMQ9_ENSVE|nr:hypothetical protein B296_00035262 [Ensete ventricosum]